jgi:hypothetical protein
MKPKDFYRHYQRLFGVKAENRPKREDSEKNAEKTMQEKKAKHTIERHKR